jgi:hypothetical protein
VLDHGHVGNARDALPKELNDSSVDPRRRAREWRHAAVRRRLYRALSAIALLTLLAKLGFALVSLPRLDRAQSEPPPAPRGLSLQAASRDHVFGSVTDRTFAFFKSRLRPGDRFYLAASARSVGTPHGRLDVWVPSTFYFLPNIMTLDFREADVVFAVGSSPLPQGHYRLVAKDRAGNRVFRRVATL